MTQTIKPIIAFKRPEVLKGTVEFPLPDGTTAKLACEFDYRTRKEFGKLWDEINASSHELAKPKVAKPKGKGKAADEAPAAAFTFEAMMDRANEMNADNTLRYLKKWPDDLPELSKEALMQLFDEAPASQTAFFAAYRNLCTTGFAGN